jgi:hypothetical protein
VGDCDDDIRSIADHARRRSRKKGHQI